MKKVEILDKYNKPLFFDFNNITNFVGENNDLKNYIYSYLEKYFSKTKYLDDSISIYDLRVPYVKVNGEEVGRSFYKIYSISNEDDLNNCLMTSKGSLLNEYVLNLFNSVEVSSYIFKIEDLLTKITIDLKNESENIEGLNFFSDSVNKEFLLKSFLDIKVSTDDYPLTFMSNYDKISIFLKLIEEIAKVDNSTKLIMFKNIENFVDSQNIDELTKTIKDLSNMYNIDFLIMSSKPGYIICDIGEVSDINIVTDEIRSLIDISSLTNTINRNYPANIQFSEEEVFRIIRKIANNLFTPNYTLGLSQSDVVIKLLNGFYDIECKTLKKNICELELNYLLS